jgi:hypothetical protein
VELLELELEPPELLEPELDPFDPELVEPELFELEPEEFDEDDESDEDDEDDEEGEAASPFFELGTVVFDESRLSLR